jgi:hypothetical protein
VGVRINFHEQGLRDAIKAAGAIWLPERKLWQLSHRRAILLGLRERIVGAI